MVRIKRREYPAFVTLFDRYRPSAVTFAARMLGDAEAAEHIAHEAFSRTAKQATSFNPEKTRFRIWFFATLRKLISKHALVNRTDPGRLEQFTTLGHVTDASSVASRADEARTLLENLGRLNSVYREVVHLRRYEKMSYDEIASVCGEKLATIKSRMNYVVERLRKGLQKRI